MTYQYASEAVLAGCKLVPPGHGVYISHDAFDCQNGACFIGAGMLACGYKFSTQFWLKYHILQTPALAVFSDGLSEKTKLGKFLEWGFEVFLIEREKLAELLSKIEKIEEEVACEWKAYEAMQRWLKSIDTEIYLSEAA